MIRTPQDCAGTLHPKAIEGIRLFNEGKFFEAHEELEIAWNEDPGPIRDLYRGILQIAVTYLHITRGNYDGAVKVYGRSLKWMDGWDDVCRGIHIGKLREDAGRVMDEVERLGRDGIGKFDPSYFKPIQYQAAEDGGKSSQGGSRKWICDRCGSEMDEKNCKVTCPNCGNRFDCSDLNLYFD
jgi:hypothetical protein